MCYNFPFNWDILFVVRAFGLLVGTRSPTRMARLKFSSKSQKISNGFQGIQRIHRQLDVLTAYRKTTCLRCQFEDRVHWQTWCILTGSMLVNKVHIGRKGAYCQIIEHIGKEHIDSNIFERFAESSLDALSSHESLFCDFFLGKASNRPRMQIGIG